MPESEDSKRSNQFKPLKPDYIIHQKLFFPFRVAGITGVARKTVTGHVVVVVCQFTGIIMFMAIGATE